jgi:hypothetical protein
VDQRVNQQLFEHLFGDFQLPQRVEASPGLHMAQIAADEGKAAEAGVKSCNPANSLTRNRSPLIRRIHTHKACPALQAASTLPCSLVCRPIPEPLAG